MWQCAQKNATLSGMKMKFSTIATLLAMTLMGCDSGTQTAAATPLPEKAELLATNTVSARYVQVVDQPCRFMTALCPDKCDHATKLAQFEVLNNEHYEKRGEYGDEKMEPHTLAVVDVQKPVPGQSPEVAKLISELKPGEVVTLTINHYYVQQGQGQFPVRPVVSMKRSSSVEAK